MTPESLVAFHTALLGAEPTEDQRRIYDAYARAPATTRGFGDADLSVEKFEATFLLAVGEAFHNEQIVLFTPQKDEKWVIDQVKVVQKRLFENIKNREGLSGRRLELAKSYAKCIRRLFIASRLFQLPDVPAHWLAFGYTKEDTIPEWMRDALLPV